MHEERRWIRRIQRSGDRDAADALIRKYYDEIERYISLQVGDEHAAMDLTQNVFLSMLRTIGGYDHRKASFRTWLYHIATYKLIDYYRSMNTAMRKTIDIDEADYADERDFTLEIERREADEKLMLCIGGIDADLQQIFRLKFFGEFTFAQIAARLAQPESTVKSKYYRLLKTIRKAYEDES